MTQDVRRVAVVTGGASGIGLAVVARLLDEGWAVVAADVNPDSTAERLDVIDSAALRTARGDVTVEDDVRGLVDTAVGEFGRLDCIVNNAGISGAFGPITEIDADHWDHTFAVLVRGVFLGTKHAARRFVAQGGGGAIVNMASIAAFDGGCGPQAYSAAKAAVANLTLSTAVELAAHRIRVNSVAPGSVITPMWMKGRDSSHVDQALELQPLKEVTTPEHVAEAVSFLADPESRMITGACITVDGGIHAAGANLAERLGNGAGGLTISGLNMGTTGARSVVTKL